MGESTSSWPILWHEKPGEHHEKSREIWLSLLIVVGLMGPLNKILPSFQALNFVFFQMVNLPNFDLKNNDFDLYKRIFHGKMTQILQYFILFYF